MQWVHRWEPGPPLVCRHPNEFHVRSIKPAAGAVKLTGAGENTQECNVKPSGALFSIQIQHHLIISPISMDIIESALLYILNPKYLDTNAHFMNMFCDC